MKRNGFHDNNNNNLKSYVKENGFEVSKATTKQIKRDYFLFITYILLHFNLQSVL